MMPAPIDYLMQAQPIAQKGGPGAPLDELITEYGGGSGARGGGYSPPAKAKPEIQSPQRGAAGTGMADIDWVGALRSGGFHETQIKNMTPQQIQETAMRLKHAQLGPMLAPLRELGYGPAQLMRMTPQDAYKAIKGKFISQPTGGSPLEQLLKGAE